eukprot:1748454-Rhodomonas_salina.3
MSADFRVGSRGGSRALMRSGSRDSNDAALARAFAHLLDAAQGGAGGGGGRVEEAAARGGEQSRRRWSRRRR